MKLNIIKPVSPKAVKFALSFEEVYFFEEGLRNGGIGEEFALLLLENGFKGKYKLTAVNDEYVRQGSVSDQTKAYGLDKNSMLKVISEGK